MMRLRRSKTIIASALALACIALSSCGVLTKNQEVFEPSEVVKKDESYYLSQLRSLPLRFYEEGRWHIEIGTGPNDAAIREVHMLRDSSVAAVLREPKPTKAEDITIWNRRRSQALHKDTLLIVRDDMTVVSIAARTFTVNWTSRITERVNYKPIMTKDSIFFIDRNGVYERLDRHTGVVTNRSSFGTGFFPNAQPTANDSHIIIPTTNANAVEGRPDDDASNSTNPLLWRFPSERTGSIADFGMVLSQPIADSNNIYFVSQDNHLYCLRASDGFMIWNIQLETQGIVRSTPTIQDGIIYVGSDTQLFAVTLEGKVIWTYTPDGEVIEGPVYAMDDQVFFRTLKPTLKEGAEVNRRRSTFGLASPDSSREGVFEFERSRMLGLTFTRQDERGAERVLVRRPSAPDWEIPNLDQRVLLKTDKDLFLVYEDWTVPYTKRFQEQLQQKRRNRKPLVVRDEELRVYSRRVVRVLNPKTGEVRRYQGEDASYEMIDFSFILGSNDDTDRAIYFCTKDGNLFKGFQLDSSRR